ncbi:MAG TPA: hypothetical protein VKC89_00060 [Patescibacteria group bacterium]|nr:hypothetical protein [Patescibacteria group bacterium]
MKKLIFTFFIGIGGLLLTLAGFNLIQLSQNLILYSGILLLAISALLYFLM